MRVGLYNRWLATLGGGEKASLALAEYLSQKHPVDVISHTPVSKDLAAERLNLDLSRVRFLTIPERDASEMTAITREYDLFINASHLDFFPSLAPHSAFLIYFPAKLNLNVTIRRNIKHLLRSALNLPSIVTGLRGFGIQHLRFTWFLDPVFKMKVPAQPRAYRVSFDLSAIDPAATHAHLLVNSLPQCEIHLPAPGQMVRCEVNIPPSVSASPAEIMVYLTNEVQLDGKPKLLLTNLDIDLLPYRLFQRVFENRYRGWGMKLQYDPPALAILDYIDTYNVIWGVSQYTCRWIRRYWRRDSQVLYPLVDIENFRVSEKRKQILSVGRFFAGQHNKKHLEMVQVFKQMVDQGLQGWELHLAGGRGWREEDEPYLAAIEREAQGYPVQLHISIPREELLDLYAESAIYWHAGGLGEDEQAAPEKFEHFGITTVEAMAAGCVPIVIGKGGQPEIVAHGVSGFQWKTIAELQTYTRRVIGDETLRKTLSAAARQASQRFDRVHFQATVDEFLTRIGQ